MSMSHDDPEIEGAEDAAAAHLDRLCLALGLFTNLVQVVDEVKQLVGDTSKSSVILEHHDNAENYVHQCCLPSALEKDRVSRPAAVLQVWIS